MSEALGLLEFDSIALGVYAGDAMVKRAPVDLIHAGTVHPGKYLVLVRGEVASVGEALEAGRESATGALIDQLFLPHPHPRLPRALAGQNQVGQGEAVGVVETRSVAALLGAADRGLKGAEVELRSVHLADDLGGKAYLLFQGEVADVEAAVELAVDGLASPDLLVARVVIAQIHGEMLDNLDAGARFRERLGERFLDERGLGGD